MANSKNKVEPTSKIKDTLLRKEQQLNEVFALQSSTKNRAKLNDLDKNEIEIKAQMQILRFVLS